MLGILFKNHENRENQEFVSKFNKICHNVEFCMFKISYDPIILVGIKQGRILEQYRSIICYYKKN